jgi:hypothetical protein
MSSNPDRKISKKRLKELTEEGYKYVANMVKMIQRNVSEDEREDYHGYLTDVKQLLGENAIMKKENNMGTIYNNNLQKIDDLKKKFHAIEHVNQTPEERSEQQKLSMRKLRTDRNES